ncbi:NlpC/P60 family protein, partial [uncultured Enorma sp.]|uniref:C40 family peptidase n=1 Tax=uncultured Enorma sp. TaxID=1714346 RepID=UPI0028046F0A
YSQDIDGSRYYFNGAGEMQTGWVTWSADGTRTYFGEDGAALSGWQDIDGYRYYFDPEAACHGAMWRRTIDGERYYFDGQCRMVTGLLTWGADGRRSYFGEDGKAVSGWRTVDGDRYYFDPEDVDHRGVVYSQDIDGSRYYFNGAGEMQTGAVKWNSNGKVSVFGTDGKMIESGWAKDGSDTYYIGSDGYAVQWQQRINGKLYYFDSEYRMHTGWLRWNVDGKWSYFGSDGAALIGSHVISGVLYTFDSSGKTSQPVYHGFQNPLNYYQVSCYSVSIKNQGVNKFGYRSPSVIPEDATKQDCINAMIDRAYDYLGTPYKWDYACAPGVGVDCAGLVMQSLYACGMDLSPMNPWDHYYEGLSGGWHSAYANYMWNNGRFQKLSFSKRQRGDIISWSGHVAIYLGNDRIIEAPAPGSSVRTNSVYAYGTPRGVLRPFIS